MKNFFLFLLTCVLLTFSATAQTAVAKIKYEEAEEAFTQGQYATTLTRLDEAEKILGSSNPRILYLRIMAADKVVQADPYGKFVQLQALRHNCALYLTKYETLENNEDKYRDVYKVSESLKKLPVTQADVNAHIQSLQAKENARSAELMRLARSRDYVNALVEKYRFKAGLTIEEFWVYNPAADVLKSKSKMGDLANYHVKDYATRIYKHQSVLGPFMLLVDSNGKVRNYLFCIAWETTVEARNQAFDKLIAEIKGNVPAEYVAQTDTGERVVINVPGSKAIIGIAKSDLSGSQVIVVTFSSL